jgi:hypothetical protein
MFIYDIENFMPKLKFSFSQNPLKTSFRSIFLDFYNK